MIVNVTGGNEEDKVESEQIQKKKDKDNNTLDLNNEHVVLSDIKIGKPNKMDAEVYERELSKLQVELVKFQEWIKHVGMKVVVIFEGRDAAGKGGVIKRITQRLNPRVCRIVALGTPTDREKTQWYFQRYVS
ncbi:MAG: polyphosphate kinase 2, partial [Bacteroidetes bacterium]|nr:polyphosphate kinase 2 [Bacteroidota bacterium]